MCVPRRSYGSGPLLTFRFRCEGLSAGESGLQRVPPSEAVLAALPAQVRDLGPNPRGEVDEAAAHIFEFAAEGIAPVRLCIVDQVPEFPQPRERRVDPPEEMFESWDEGIRLRHREQTHGRVGMHAEIRGATHRRTSKSSIAVAGDYPLPTSGGARSGPPAPPPPCSGASPGPPRRSAF